MRETQFERRKTREVMVGNVGIGGDNPVRVQTMITEQTASVPVATKQIIQLHQARAEIVRVTVPTMRDAQRLGEIRELLGKEYGPQVPLVADVHHQGSAIAVEAANHVDKIRINPGLFVHHKRTGKGDYSDSEINQQQEEIETALTPVIRACKERGIAMRIGVNHGSLAERLTVMYGDTPAGMVESALEYINICEANEYRDLVISLKASRVPVMQEVNRLMAQRMDELSMDYPIHLGVTEAGRDQSARIKSAIGIGTLLAEGIGDTIRVSLAENPVDEISVCYDILQAQGLRRTKAEQIGCPGCGRTKFDLPNVMDQVFAATSHLDQLAIAVMGCIVNGPGEMADADYGYVGLGAGTIALYRGRDEVRRVKQENALPALIDLIQKDGNWVDPPEGETPQVPQVLNNRIGFDTSTRPLPLFVK